MTAFVPLFLDTSNNFTQQQSQPSPIRHSNIPLTTNQETYDWKKVEPQQSFRPGPTYNSTRTPFYAQTTNQSEYGWKTAEIPEAYQRRAVYEPNPIPFNGNTTSRTEFGWKISERPENNRPDREYKPPNIPFTAESINRTEYGRMPGEKAALAKPKAEYHVLDLPFEGTTTNNATYDSKPIERTKSLRPKTSIFRLGDDNYMSNSFTTNLIDYQPLSTEAKTRFIPPQDYVRSTERFNDITTHQATYVPLEGERSKPVRPSLNLGLPQGNFDAETNYKTDFPHRPAIRLTSCPAELLLRNQGLKGTEFEGTDRFGHQWYKIHSAPQKSSLVPIG